MSKAVTQRMWCVLLCMRKVATRRDSRYSNMKTRALILCNICCALFAFWQGDRGWNSLKHSVRKTGAIILLQHHQYGRRGQKINHTWEGGSGRIS